ncbi:MAG: trigger factor [Caldisericaceae bacterium]|nr:trigger factor [Caldisericaceae bacterium]
MEYTIKEKTGSKIIFVTKNNREEIENEKKKAYKKIVQKVAVPGFRKGKAPYEIGVPFVGESRVLEDAVDILLEKNLVEFLDKEKINPVVQPDVKVDKLEEDELTCTYTVEFLPEVNIDLSEKIEVPYEKPETEKDVEAKLNELQDSFTEIVPVERAIQNGDMVSLSWQVEGRDKEPKNDTLEIGKDKFIGNFDENIIGKKKGDRFTIDFKDEKVVINVLQVKEKHVAPIDDNLAKQAGYENLEQLKSKIKEEIEENSRLQAEEERGLKALNVLVNKLDVEIPGKLVEKEIDERIQRARDEYLKIGKKIEDALKEENKTMDILREEVKKVVVESIKNELVMKEVIKKSNVTVDDNEIEEEFNKLLETNGLADKKVPLNDNIRMAIEDNILRKKAILFMKENAIIKKREGDE